MGLIAERLYGFKVRLRAGTSLSLCCMRLYDSWWCAQSWHGADGCVPTRQGAADLGDVSPGGPAARGRNALALSQSLFVCMMAPWAFCFLSYTGALWSYPRCHIALCLAGSFICSRLCLSAMLHKASYAVLLLTDTQR